MLQIKNVQSVTVVLLISEVDYVMLLKLTSSDQGSIMILSMEHFYIFLPQSFQ